MVVVVVVCLASSCGCHCCCGVGERLWMSWRKDDESFVDVVVVI